MEYKPLTYFCNINMGQSPDSNTYNNKSNGLPFYQGNADFGEIHPNTRVWCSKPIKIAYKNDVLISVRAPIGALNIANNICCIGRGLASLTPNIELTTTNYLLYALKSKVNELNQKGTGSTFKAISKKVLEETTLPFYSIAQQHKIVSILDQVNDLISLRNQQLEQLDLLIKSRFVEMFGDPARNEKGWKTGNIRDIISDVRYGTSRKSSDNGKYPYLRMNNITYSGELDLTDTKLIDIPDDELEKCSVKRGDVLFNRTNSKELVGKTCLYNRDELMVLAGFIIRIRTNEKILPIFLSNYMNLRYIKDLLFSMAKNACGQANINAQELQNIGIYIPPLALQTQFAAFVEEVEKEKATVKQSLEWLNTLKASLMQDYFG